MVFLRYQKHLRDQFSSTWVICCIIGLCLDLIRAVLYPSERLPVWAFASSPQYFICHSQFQCPYSRPFHLGQPLLFSPDCRYHWLQVRPVTHLHLERLHLKPACDTSTYRSTGDSSTGEPSQESGPARIPSPSPALLL